MLAAGAGACPSALHRGLGVEQGSHKDPCVGTPPSSSDSGCCAPAFGCEGKDVAIWARFTPCDGPLVGCHWGHPLQGDAVRGLLSHHTCPKDTYPSPFQMDMHDETYSMPDDVFESPPLSATCLRMHHVGEDARVSPEVEQPTP